MTQSFRHGLIAAFLAYGAWGVLPVYWKLLSSVPAEEVLAHRIVWSLVFLALLLTVRGGWPAFKSTVRQGKLPALTISAGLIGVNWLIFIWGVQNGKIVECSLGYFISPLVNVVFGVVLLKERLRPLQALSIVIAGAGVAIRACDVGGLPILSLGLALSFATYGLVRKRLKVDSVVGLGVETALMLIPALLFLGYRELTDHPTLSQASFTTWALLIGAGVITSLPLLAFNEAAKNLPLTIMGVVQYLSPSLQFLAGVYIYAEPIGSTQWLAFFVIWAAIVVFTLDGAKKTRESLPRALDARAK